MHVFLLSLNEMVWWYIGFISATMLSKLSAIKKNLILRLGGGLFLLWASR